MAWRIDESVIRGEIDNRTRDRVTGRIWFEGRAEPVELNLTGNAWRDLAGRRLEFVNPVAVKNHCRRMTSAVLRRDRPVRSAIARRRAK